MQLYDIALVLIRALVAMDFVRAVLSLAVDELITFPRMMRITGIFPALTVNWQSHAFAIGAAILLWLLSKPIARFAVRFAERPA